MSDRAVDAIWVLLITGFLALVGGAIYSTWKGGGQKQAYKKFLLDQCIRDGKKEYECVGLLKNMETQMVPIPIFIPLGSK